jgi:tRNA threonylcarbamoyladenosine biosynthesis protein TsaE
MQISVKNIDELPLAAKQILEIAGKEKIFVFYGEMGAGKTTLINKIAEILGVNEPTSSPTFSIVNEYQTVKGDLIYHFDFYRIKNENEAYDFGYEDYFYSDEYCMIEWPEKIPNLLPEHYMEIKIEAINENERSITIRQFS